MSRQHIWATKVAGLIQGGNVSAALAQIKVAPTVKDLQQLRKLLLIQPAPATKPLRRNSLSVRGRPVWSSNCCSVILPSR